jgi:predicted ferric reductase
MATPTRVPASRLPPRFPEAPLTADLAQPTREGLVAAVIAAGAVATLAMWWVDTSPASLHGAGPWLAGAGRVTGLLGTYLVVIGVALMGRIAWLDRLIGMDRLAVWHRRNGQYSVSLLVAHAVLIIWGYAYSDHAGVLHETTTVVLDYPDMLAATVGLALFVAIGIVSARALRRRISYQAWYFIHLYAYLGLALSFAHEFNTGVDFATHPVNRAAWIVLYAGVGLLLLVYRVGKPVRDGIRHQMRVEKVVDEAPGTVSVWITGRDLDRLRPAAGQFFLWRFLTKDGWWQAHPYSLSSVPNRTHLRVTVKGLGDHSRDLPALRPGTRLVAEGPYGAFTPGRRRMRKVVLIGGGVGITPLRALFESLPGDGRDLSLIYRAGGPDEVLFRSELDAIAAGRGARIAYLVGSRTEHPGWLTARHLKTLLPDIGNHDVYLCGPPGLVASVEASLADLHVPRRQIHTEHFEL